MPSLVRNLAYLALGLLSGSCGYHLRGNTRDFFDHHQIRTLYVSPVKNDSYKSGIEITVYNALRKRIAQGGYVRIVDSPSNADAQIIASVREAGYASTALVAANALSPVSSDSLNPSAPNDVLIASIYEARLRVSFSLINNRDRRLWSDELLRTRRFSASTYYGSVGATSPLINESEFERSLSELSVSIVTDAEESINTAI